MFESNIAAYTKGKNTCVMALEIKNKNEAEVFKDIVAYNNVL